MTRRPGQCAFKATPRAILGLTLLSLTLTLPLQPARSTVAAPRETAPTPTASAPTAPVVAPTSAATTTATGVPTPVANSTGADDAARAGANGNWQMYLHDDMDTAFNAAETAINQSTVASLKTHWIRSLAPISSTQLDAISTQVVQVGNTIYWGSWDGYEHASSASTGSDVWSTYIGQETKPDCSPPLIGVASSAYVGDVTIGGTRTRVLFVGGGDGTFRALNAATGAVIWQQPFGSPQNGYFLWSSPTVYGSSVYMGVASIGDCPLIPGEVVKMDAATGAIQQTWHAAPAGCVGSGVWSSFAVDRAAGTLYFSTGTTGSCSVSGQALVEVRLGDLSTVGVWQVPPSQQVFDGDFGATPTLFTATISGTVQRMVGLINKNDTYYAFRRDAITAGPVWQTARLSSQSRSIAASAWDGTRLYLASYGPTPLGGSCDGLVSALDPATGAILWQQCSHGTGAPEGAAVVVPGVVVAALGSELYAYNSANGQQLWSFQDTSFNWFWAAPSISHGTLYAPNSDGNLFAFTPNGT